jgi:uncharacterized OB-fold protein
MEREIYAYKCRKCGQLALPVPDGLQGVPTLGLGIVELENGIRITGQLDIDQPRIGMEVTGEVGVVRRSAYDDYYGMVFTAA